MQACGNCCRTFKWAALAAGALTTAGTIMPRISSITIRRARRDDVGVIVGMLADDPLGSGRERLEDPLPPSHFRAVEAIEHYPNIQFRVAQDDQTPVGPRRHLSSRTGLPSQVA